MEGQKGSVESEAAPLRRHDLCREVFRGRSELASNRRRDDAARAQLAAGECELCDSVENPDEGP